MKKMEGWYFMTRAADVDVKAAMLPANRLIPQELLGSGWAGWLLAAIENRRGWSSTGRSGYCGAAIEVPGNPNRRRTWALFSGAAPISALTIGEKRSLGVPMQARNAL